MAGCCRRDHQALTVEDTAVCICNNCMAMIDEDAAGSLENIWVLIDGDPGFPLPDYTGKTMGVQDCGRAYDRSDVQDAVRSLMCKMGIEVVELADAREGSVFCGRSFLRSVPAQDASFAPMRYVEDAARRGLFPGLEDEEIHEKMVEHAEVIEPDEVCCYCFACDIGLEDGGKVAHNLLELISGKIEEA